MKLKISQINKRWLALLLAVSVILSSVASTLLIQAMAEDAPVGVEHFEVTYGSPAVPMVVNKRINLYDLLVQFERDGEFVSGRDITWSAAEEGSPADTFLHEINKTFAATETGIFKIIATYGSKERPVYIMVNAEGDYTFDLVDVDYSNGVTFSEDEWMYVLSNGVDTVYAENGTDKVMHWSDPTNADYYKVPVNTSRVTTKTNYLQIHMGQSANAIYYKAPILKDFADYTFTANVSTDNDYNNKNIGRGFVLRADVNFNAPYYNAESEDNKTIFTFDGDTIPSGGGLYLVSHPVGGISIGAFNKPYLLGSSLNYGFERVTLHSLTGDNLDSIKSLVASNYLLNHPSTLDAANNSVPKKVEIVLDGRNIKYTYNDSYTVLDTASENLSKFDVLSPNSTTNFAGDYANAFDSKGRYEGGGAIGFTVAHAAIRIFSFNVRLNGIDDLEDMPIQLPLAIAVEDGAELVTLDSLWHYLDDGVTDPGTAEDMNAWTKLGFDDSSWKANDGKEATFGVSDSGSGSNGSENRLNFSSDPYIGAYFFRTSFNLDKDPAGYTFTANLKIDDTAIVYINGKKVAEYYTPYLGYTSNLGDDSLGYVDKDSTSAASEETLVLDAGQYLNEGENIIAVSVHQANSGSSDAYFEMTDATLSLNKDYVPSISLLDKYSTWSYLDDNTDPGSADDLTSWTKLDFDDSAWKTNGYQAAMFGAKTGSAASLGTNPILNKAIYPNVLINHYIDGQAIPVIPTYFFRATFNVDASPVGYLLEGNMLVDDAAIVYINGVRVTDYYMTKEPDGTNLYYDGAKDEDTPTPETFTVNAADYLKVGENVIAVEIHNERNSSSDIYFGMNSLMLVEDTSFTKKVEGETVALGDENSIWKYHDTYADPGTAEDRYAWTKLSYDDLGWKTSIGSDKLFGGSNGGTDSTTSVAFSPYKVDIDGTSSSLPAAFMRTYISLDRIPYSYFLNFTLHVDDNAIVYINGKAVYELNLPADGFTSNLAYSGKGGENTVDVSLDAGTYLTEGLNIIAIEVHNDRYNSSDLIMELTNLELVYNPDYVYETPDLDFELGNELLNLNSVWRYLDNGTDPGTTEDRYAWTKLNYNTDEWKTNMGFEGKFGTSMANATPAIKIDRLYPGTETNIPTFFFRSTFVLDEVVDGMLLNGSIKFDDAAILYINGKKAASFCAADSYETNLSYGSTGGGGNPTTSDFSIDADDFLVAGKNVVSVEIHQSNATSSDFYFEFTEASLVLDTNYARTVSLGVGANETERYVTWQLKFNKPAYLQYAVAGGADNNGDGFPDDYTEVLATPSSAINSGFYTERAKMTNLAYDTEYVYRLVNEEGLSSIPVVSDIYTFKTDKNSTSFSFLFAGDPQIGAGNLAKNVEGWTNTLNQARATFPNSSLLVSAGDQVEKSLIEDHYNGYLTPELITSYTNAVSVGNHDHTSATLKEHFSSPNVSSTYGVTSAGSDYYYTYNGTLFMHLTTDLSVAEHKAFMQEAIAANPNATWKIAVFHFSVYSAANHCVKDDILNLRAGLVPVLNELDIDVVLMGHDHVYVRTYMMNGLTPEDENGVQYSAHNPEGILFVTANSSSGSKYYDIKTELEFPYGAVISQEKKPTIANIEITATSFEITTYRTEDMSVLDTFKITKSTDEPDTPVVPDTPVDPEVPATITVQKNESAANSYTATVTPNGRTLIPNSLVVLENGKENKALALLANGGSGLAFSFNSLTGNVTVTAKYLEDEDMTAKYGSSIENDIFFLGREIRIKGAQSAGIKFVNRLPAIKYNSANGTISSNSIILDDGTTATVKAIGTLVIPSVLLRNAELKIPADQEANFNADAKEVVLGSLNGQSALNIKHQTVTAYSENFSDVKAILGGLDELGLTEAQYKALQISAVTYIQYEKADGTIGYAYGDVQQSSYNDVWNAMYPTYDTHSDYFEVYTDKTLYEDDDNITVMMRVPGNCKVRYFLYEDGKSQELLTNVVDGPIVVLTIPASLTKDGGKYNLALYVNDYFGENSLPLDPSTPYVQKINIRTTSFDVEDDDDGFIPGYW